MICFQQNYWMLGNRQLWSSYPVCFSDSFSKKIANNFKMAIMTWQLGRKWSEEPNPILKRSAINIKIIMISNSWFVALCRPNLITSNFLVYTTQFTKNWFGFKIDKIFFLHHNNSYLKHAYQISKSTKSNNINSISEKYKHSMTEKSHLQDHPPICRK